MSRNGARNTADEELLQLHLQETFPTSLEGWLGKEHFWDLGDRTEIPRHTAGKLFMELCFPIKNKARRVEDVQTIDPTDLGLVISTRCEQSRPYPPVLVATMSTSMRAFAHFERRGIGIWQNTQPLADTIIQAESVVHFANDVAAHSAAVFTPAALGAVTVFGAELSKLPRSDT
jgi:hypothetical protein